MRLDPLVLLLLLDDLMLTIIDWMAHLDLKVKLSLQHAWVVVDCGNSRVSDRVQRLSGRCLLLRRQYVLRTLC